MLGWKNPIKSLKKLKKSSESFKNPQKMHEKSQKSQKLTWKIPNYFQSHRIPQIRFKNLKKLEKNPENP